MKKILAALLLSLSSSTAFAQCSGQAPANTYCGNNTGVQAIPGWKPASGVAVPGGTNGQIQYNNAGAFGGLTNTQLTARINPFTSSLSGAVPASGGGTANFLRADGTWAAPPAGTPAALTRVDDTNVTLTLGGSPATALLQATSLTLGWTGQLSLTRGGTNNSLTASNGGIVWSDASKLNILAGTATAGQMLRSGSSATPSWSTATWPATTNANRLLYSSSANTVAELTSAASSVLVTDGSSIPSWSTTLPGVTFSGQVVFNITRSIASSTGAALDDVAVASATTTVTGNTGSPITRLSKVSLYKPTFTDSSAVVVSDLANFYIDGQPIVAGSLTATRTWSAFLKDGSMWISGTGQSNGRLLIGSLIPSDWPVDALVVTSEMTGQNAVGINAAPVLSTPPGSNKNAFGITTQAQIAAGQAWTQFEGIKVEPIFLNAGASVTNQYGIHIKPITGAGTINQALWVEGTSSTGGRIGIGDSRCATQFCVSNNVTPNIPAGSAQGAYYGIDGGNGGAIGLFGFGGAFSNPQIFGTKISGTAAAPTATAANVTLFQIFGQGYNGVTPGTYSQGARIDFVSTGTIWSGTNNGAEIALYSTPDASTTTAEGLRLLGAGNVKFSNAASFSANGAVATTLGSVGPTGSRTTVQKWLTIVDNGGITGYIPVF